MPIRAFLAMHVSVCLLIATTCSAVFARFGWLNRFGTADRSVFLFERLFQLFEGLSCRLIEPSARQAELLCVALVGRRFFCVCDCFVVADVLRTAVALVCWSGGFLFRF